MVLPKNSELWLEFFLYVPNFVCYFKCYLFKLYFCMLLVYRILDRDLI